MKGSLYSAKGLTTLEGYSEAPLSLHKKFGKGRVMDIPIAENGMTGVVIGAAMAGMRPIFVHMRMDFFTHVYGPDSQPRCKVVLHDRRQDECAPCYKEYHW